MTVYLLTKLVIFTNLQMTSILGLIKGGDETHYWQLVDSILAYGEENCLVLNADKTKELILEFRKKAPPPTSPAHQRCCGAAF